ncbi:MAG: ribosome silencing factor [Deltaproteobacteria bacterium]|nr:ribosome silencing factor [Deltaproteobacteria bacterium]
MARIAVDKQAGNAVILNVAKLTSVADYLVICSAESERQVKAISDAVEDELRGKGDRPLGVEGAQTGRWALLDCNDVIVHVFLASVREFYDIDGLWAEAPRISAAPRAPSAAHRKPRSAKTGAKD